MPFLKNISGDTGIEDLDYRVVVVGPVYGPRMGIVEYHRFLEGEKDQYLYVSDVVYGIAKAMFTSGTRGKIFWLGYTKPTALSSVETALLSGWQPRVDPSQGQQQTRQYFDQNKTVSLNHPVGRLPNDNPKPADKPTSLRPVSNQSIFNFRIEPQAQSLVEPEHVRLTLPAKKTKTSRLFTVFLILAIVILPTAPAVFFGANVYLAYSRLKESQQSLQEGNFEKSKAEAQTAKKYLAVVKPFSQTATGLLLNIGWKDPDRQLNYYFEVATLASNLLEDSAQSAMLAGRLTDTILGRNDSDVDKQEILKLATNLESVYVNLSYLQLLAKGTAFEKRFAQLFKNRNNVLAAQRSIEMLPSLIGVDQKKTYLVLLQNNSELRPTGGFIGSFALITFDKGRMSDFQVQDVYWADGQLQGHVEPPEKLKQHLGEAGWYLRDSNWDPDFPTSAARAAWFLEKETGRSVDGVIGVNMYLAQGILKATGEVQLVDFKETINWQNLFDRAEYYSETNFFPGSTQKQDFLGSLARSLLEEIKSASPQTALNLAGVVADNITSKDLSIYLKNTKLEKQLIGLGWAGELKKPACLAENCIADNLIVVDANVGVNKANYFIKRTINHNISLDPGGIPMQKAIINYVNNSQTENFPGGRYKNYLRLYLSDRAIFDYIQIKDGNGSVIKNLSEKEIDLSFEHNLQVIGLLLEVPIQDARTVEVTYHLSVKLDRPENKYIFVLQKQPGILDEQVIFNFKVEPNYIIAKVSPDGQFNQGSYNFTGKFDRDLVWEIDLKH